MTKWIAIIALAGCSEYHVEPDPDTNDTPDDSDVDTTDTGEVIQTDCPDQEFPGYDGSIDGDCQNSIEPGSFTPIVEWSRDSFSVHPASKSVMMEPIVIDVNADGTPDVAAVSYEGTSFDGYGVLRILSGDDGRELFSVDGTQLAACSGLAAADIDGDGSVEIVGMTLDGRAIAFESDGTIAWTSDSLLGHVGNYGADAPAISDMDGDGSPEIVVGSAILNADGTIRGLGNRGIGFADNYGALSFAVDIDGDGTQEVVVGNALYRPDGSTIWSNGEADGYPAVGNFDVDDNGEIVVCGNKRCRLQDDDGSVIWDIAIPNAHLGYGGPPTIADFDGDGEPEIGVAADSTYTVLDPDGTMLWQRNTQDGSSGVTGSAVFDFEGDGAAEVIYADETTVWVYSGVNGQAKMADGDHSSWTINEYPTVADVDGDGHAEIIVARNELPSGSSQRYGIAVFGDADDSWQAGRPIWNQHAYHITNVEDDGAIPANPLTNWLYYNNFRSGDVLAGSGLNAPDLTLALADVCDADCDEDQVVIWVNPGNLGAADIRGGIVIDVFGHVDSGDYAFLTSVSVGQTIPMGTYADGIQIAVQSADLTDFDFLEARIRSRELDCEDGNNVVRVDGPFCQ